MLVSSIMSESTGLRPEDWRLVAETCLIQGTRVHVPARGGSMRPFLFSGDQLEVAPIAPADLRVGDIVLIWTPEKFPLAHRIVRIIGDGTDRRLDLKGDANLRLDQVSPADVIGIVVAVIRDDRRLPLDRGWRRVAGRLWAWLMPVRPSTYPLLRGAWRLLRRLIHTLSDSRRHHAGQRWKA